LIGLLSCIAKLFLKISKTWQTNYNTIFDLSPQSLFVNFLARFGVAVLPYLFQRQWSILLDFTRKMLKNARNSHADLYFCRAIDMS